MSSLAPSWLRRFTFDRVDRGLFELSVDWYPAHLPEDEALLAKALDRMCTAITEELRVRRGLDEKHAEPQSARKWLKPVCYNAILTCMHLDVIEELVERQERFGRFKRGPKPKRSIFDDALKGIFAHEGPPTAKELRGRRGRELSKGKELLHRKDRERLANEMWWGFRHYAEPAELNGFNRAYPLHRTSSTNPAGVMSTLYRQVVKRRILFGTWYNNGQNVEQYRDSYYARLEGHVEMLGLRFERVAGQCRARLAAAETILGDDDDDEELVNYEDDEDGESDEMPFIKDDDTVEFVDDDTWVEDD